MPDFKAKIHQNPILAAALFRTCWESLQRSPGLLLREGSGKERGVEGKGGEGRQCCGVQKLP